MDDLRVAFDRLQDLILAIVDLVNERNKGGHDYGTGSRITPVEAHTIRAVGDNQGLNLTSLAQSMKVTKATMSERVKKFVELGLLRKSKALDNQKEILITLTEQGRVVYDGHEAMHQKVFDLFVLHCGEQTKEQLELFNQAFSDYLAVARSIVKGEKE